MFFNNKIILEQQKWDPVAILQCNNLKPAI